MSIELYRPNQKIPYTAEQLSMLCSPEAISPEDFLEDAWLSSRYGIFYVKDNVPLGVAFSSVRGGKKGTERHLALHVLCVSQTERKSGIGGVLLKRVDELTRSLGLNSIRISAIANQLPFYGKNSFVIIEPEDDEGTYFLMKKTLSGGDRHKKTKRVHHRRVGATRARRRVL